MDEGNTFSWIYVQSRKRRDGSSVFVMILPFSREAGDYIFDGARSLVSGRRRHLTRLHVHLFKRGSSPRCAVGARYRKALFARAHIRSVGDEEARSAAASHPLTAY